MSDAHCWAGGGGGGGGRGGGGGETDRQEAEAQTTMVNAQLAEVQHQTRELVIRHARLCSLPTHSMSGEGLLSWIGMIQETQLHKMLADNVQLTQKVQMFR